MIQSMKEQDGKNIKEESIADLILDLYLYQNVEHVIDQLKRKLYLLWMGNYKENGI